jgi:hypothetical protein
MAKAVSGQAILELLAAAVNVNALKISRTVTENQQVRSGQSQGMTYIEEQVLYPLFKPF